MSRSGPKDYSEKGGCRDAMKTEGPGNSRKGKAYSRIGRTLGNGIEGKAAGKGGRGEGVVK